MENEITQMTTRDYLRVLFRQKAVVIVTVLTVVTTVFIGLKFRTPVYEAQVKVLVSAEKQVQSPFFRDLIGSRTAEVTVTQGEIVKSAPVIERTVRALSLYKRPFNYEAKYCNSMKRSLVEFSAKLQTERFNSIAEQMKTAYLYRMAIEDLRHKIKVEPIRDTNTFTISVKDYDPVGAATIANTLSRSYLIYDLQQQMAEMQMKYGDKHPSVIQLQDNITELAKTLHGQPVSILDALGTASSKVVEQADVPIEPTGIKKPLLFILGCIMSIFLAVMLAFVFEYMDHTIKTPQEIETFLGLPFLGGIPRNRRLRSQAMETLADQIYLIMKDKNLKSLMVTRVDTTASSAPMVANLGRALAGKSSQRVLLIDADLRDPRFQKELRLPGGPGLAEILEGKTNFEACVKTKGQGLAVLTAGQTALNPVTLIDSVAMRNLLKAMREKFDAVFVNVPPLMPHKDSETLAGFVDGTVVIVTEGKTRRPVAQAAIQPLKEKKMNVIGAVLNKRTFPVPKFLYERI